MLIKLVCPQCSGQMEVDDSRENIFCTYCGTKIVNVPQKVEFSYDRSNDPNLYISYASTEQRVIMVTRIVSNGQKNTYINGQSASFHLPKGKHTIVLKIGKINYNRDIFIPEDNSPVRINASFNGRAHIDIDQPYYTDTTTGEKVNKVATNDMPMAPFAIIAFILSLTYYLSPFGIALGIYDKVKGDKTKRHTLSVAAIVIGIIMTLSLLFNLGGGNTAKTNNTEAKTSTSISASSTEGVKETTKSAAKTTAVPKATATPAATATPKPTATPVPTPNIWNGGGTYLVGSDIPAGEYVIWAKKGSAYWEVDKDSSGTFSSIIANGNVSSYCYITLDDNQYFNLRNGQFASVEDMEPLEPDGDIYPEGMYKVGRDIPAGEYIVAPYSTGETTYVEVAKDSRGTMNSIFANESFYERGYVTINDGQYITVSRGALKAADSCNPSSTYFPDGNFTSGMYKVGFDLPAGKYTITADDSSCYIEIDKNSLNTFGSIIKNEIIDYGETYTITVKNGQYVKFHGGILTAAK